MDKFKRKIEYVAKRHGFKKLNQIEKIDTTRFAAIVGKTGIKIIVDIQTENVWQWIPFKKRLVLQQRKVGE